MAVFAEVKIPFRAAGPPEGFFSFVSSQGSLNLLLKFSKLWHFTSAEQSISSMGLTCLQTGYQALDKEWMEVILTEGLLFSPTLQHGINSANHASSLTHCGQGASGTLTQSFLCQAHPSRITSSQPPPVLSLSQALNQPTKECPALLWVLLRTPRVCRLRHPYS